MSIGVDHEEVSAKNGTKIQLLFKMIAIKIHEMNLMDEKSHSGYLPSVGRSKESTSFKRTHQSAQLLPANHRQRKISKCPKCNS